MGDCHLDDLEALVVEEEVGKDHQDTHMREMVGTTTYVEPLPYMVFPHTTTPKENLNIGSNYIFPYTNLQ
jgi:hypothetical protein